ncbi:ATP-binding cassette sub-family A member 1 [Trichonephila clavipes]|nr:ATP-binding cassette sub-family A member 1 [Trichonephila clavipes]
MWSMVAQRLIQITPPAATPDQLWQRVEAAWSAVPQEHIQSLFESMLRRVAQLKTIFPVEERVIEGYGSFLDVVRASAKNNYTNWRDIIQLVVSGLRFVDTLDGKDHKLRPSLHVLNSLISLLKNRVSDAAQSSSSAVLEIQNVFPDSPLTREVVQSFLPVFPEVTSTLFWTALAPGKILKLIDESDKNISVIIAEVCNTSLTDYFYNPGLTSAEFETLGGVLCSHQYYDVFEEIFEDPDIQEIAFETTSTDEVSWEDMQDNLMEIVSLLQDLSERKKADISSFPPLIQWQKMAMDIHTQVMNPSVMLYILNSKFFYRFCYDNQFRKMPPSLKSFFDESKELSLYRTLCAMSTTVFADELAEGLNTTVQNIIMANGKSGSNFASMSRNVMNIFFNTPEVKNIGKLILDLDSSESSDVRDIERSSNVRSSTIRYNTATAGSDVVQSGRSIFDEFSNICGRISAITRRMLSSKWSSVCGLSA